MYVASAASSHDLGLGSPVINEGGGGGVAWVVSEQTATLQKMNEHSSPQEKSTKHCHRKIYF